MFFIVIFFVKKDDDAGSTQTSADNILSIEVTRELISLNPTATPAPDQMLTFIAWLIHNNNYEQ